MMVDEAEKESESTSSRQFSADLCMLGVAAIWGLNMPIMKFALSRVDEYLFNAMRLFVSAIVLAIFVFWQKAKILNRAEGATPISQQIWMICTFAFFTGFAYQLLFLFGIDRTTAGNTALIMSALPMWTAILAFFLIGERLNLPACVGLLVALIGTLIVTMTVPRSFGAEGSLLGNLLVSAATFSWALGSVWSKPMMKNISPIGLAFFGVALAVPAHFLVAMPAMNQVNQFLKDPLLLIALLFSGGFSTGLAYAMWNYGVKMLGTSHAAVFQNLVPFFALFASWILLGEIPGWLQVIGGVVILAGLVAMRRNREIQKVTSKKFA